MNGTNVKLYYFFFVGLHVTKYLSSSHYFYMLANHYTSIFPLLKPRLFLLHQSRLAVTEELHIIKFVTGLQHAGLKCNIEVSKHDTQKVRGISVSVCALQLNLKYYWLKRRHY